MINYSTFIQWNNSNKKKQKNDIPNNMEESQIHYSK